MNLNIVRLTQSKMMFDKLKKFFNSDTDTEKTEEKALSNPCKYTVEEVKEHVIVALKTVYDPEIPLNIYELGLIYNIDVDAEYSHSAPQNRIIWIKFRLHSR